MVLSTSLISGTDKRMQEPVAESAWLRSTSAELPLILSSVLVLDRNFPLKVRTALRIHATSLRSRFQLEYLLLISVQNYSLTTVALTLTFSFLIPMSSSRRAIINSADCCGHSVSICHRNSVLMPNLLGSARISHGAIVTDWILCESGLLD